MKFSVLLFLSFCLAVTSLEVVVPATVQNDLYAIPNYSVAYSVSDVLTGDRKSSQETRVGDVVKGSYSFTQPDGVIRTVVYTSSPLTGFQAQVINKGTSLHHPGWVAPVAVSGGSIEGHGPRTGPPVGAPGQTLGWRWTGPRVIAGVPVPVLARFSTSNFATGWGWRG